MSDIRCVQAFSHARDAPSCVAPGQGAGLRDALLFFLDAEPEPPNPAAATPAAATPAAAASGGAWQCPVPSGGGQLHRFTGPGVANPSNPSWENTGYYAFDSLSVGAGDVVCLEPGAWVEGHLVQDSEGGCSGHNIQVAGAGVWSGLGASITPADDRRALIQLCGANISVTGITTANALGPNVELSPCRPGRQTLLGVCASLAANARHIMCAAQLYEKHVGSRSLSGAGMRFSVHPTPKPDCEPRYWYRGYRDVPSGEMQRRLGANRIDNVKSLSTWWYSTDGLYAGPWGEVCGPA